MKGEFCIKLLPLYRGPLPDFDPWAFGYRLPFYCYSCRAPRTATLYVSDRNWAGEPEGILSCNICGSTDVEDHDERGPFRAKRRFKAQSILHTERT